MKVLSQSSVEVVFISLAFGILKIHGIHVAKRTK